MWKSLLQWCSVPKSRHTSGHIWVNTEECIRLKSVFKWLLLIVMMFQSAMSFEAGMQPRRHSSSSSSHSFGQIDSLRQSHHRHRPTLSPSAAKKRPSGSPQVGGALLVYWCNVLLTSSAISETGICDRKSVIVKCWIPEILMHVFRCRGWRNS